MVWKEAADKVNRKYYYNTETRETRWEKPEELYTDLEKKLVAGGWFWRYTKEGRLYYYNKESKESSWTIPAKFQSAGEAEPKVVEQELDLDESRDSNDEESKSQFEGMLIMEGLVSQETPYEQILPLLVTKSSFWLIKPALARRELYYEINENSQGLEFAERVERMVKRFRQDSADGSKDCPIDEIIGKNNLEYEFAYYKYKQAHTDTKLIEAAARAQFERLKAQSLSKPLVQCLQTISRDQRLVLPSEWEAACRSLIENAESELAAGSAGTEPNINDNFAIAKVRLAFMRALEQSFKEARISVDTPWSKAQAVLIDELKAFAEKVYDKCYQGPTPCQIFTAFIKSQRELVTRTAEQIRAKLAEQNQTIGLLESKDLSQYIDSTSLIVNHAQSVYQLLIEWWQRDRRAVRRASGAGRAVELEY